MGLGAEASCSRSLFAALAGAVTSFGCGAKSELATLDAAPPPVDASPGDAGSAPVPRQNLCIGFGLGEPVVGHPLPALPLLCGLDCSNGQSCPAEALCYAVYAPELRGETWVVSDRVVAHQCGPRDRVCDAHEMGERYCRWCDADRECE